MSPLGNESDARRFLAVARRSARFRQEKNWNAEQDHAENSERRDPAGRIDDRIPEQEFSEIIWRSVKGAASPMPPIVRSAWLRPASGLKVDDDDDR